jgi:hypothetical protein
MTRIKNKDEASVKPRTDTVNEPAADDDTEGHMFQPDLSTSRHLAQSRSAEIERELRDRQRQKEARPNRR